MVAIGDLLRGQTFPLDSSKVQGDGANFNRLELRVVDWKERYDLRFDVRVDLVDPDGNRCLFTAYSFNDQTKIIREHRKIRDALRSGDYLVNIMDEEQFELEIGVKKCRVY